MIRAFLATALVLVVAWNSSSLVFARVDESQYTSSTGGPQQHPASTDPTRVAIMRAQPALSLNRFGSSTIWPVPAPADMGARDAGVFEMPVGPALTLEDSTAPMPRPAEVTTSRPLKRPPTAHEILAGADVPPPPASLRNASDLSCIAVAIYHEARDQSRFGQRAVASVILQRAAVPHRWGDTACDNVVPLQFSFMTSRYDYPPISDMTSWNRAMRLAAEATLEGPLPELKGADHYHTTAVSPDWAPKMDRVLLIGDHIFYADPGSLFSL